LRGTLEWKTINGPLTGRNVNYGLYLPEEYLRHGQQRFATLYFLHGLNEDYTANLETVAEALESAVEQGAVRPMLVVTPDGYGNSMWADSKSGHKPAETNLVGELIPFIDRTYRTVADRRHRIIGGFSMGGYGACRHTAKFPELFQTCFSMDGALHTLNTLMRIRGPIFEEIYENDEAYFRHYCLYAWAAKNRALLKDHLFHMLVGLLKSFNDRFRRLFAEIGLAIGDAHYRVTGCGHDAACILKQAGPELFRLLEARMSIEEQTMGIIQPLGLGRSALQGGEWG
jgi:enterochelin esterase-like enzyme